MADRVQAGVLAAAAAGDELAFRRIIADHHQYAACAAFRQPVRRYSPDRC